MLATRIPFARMPSIFQNQQQWKGYDWAQGGSEWSVAWGSSAGLWAATLLPRIRPYLPAEHILEIAPGYGRCTQFLLEHCRGLTIVDLAPNCIKACKKRFGWFPGLKAHVNDGRSLKMVKDNSIDFAFSWDSMVHVEADVMRDYVAQLGRKLKPGAAAFLHHSNVGAFATGPGGALTVENPHWRGATMSAALLREFCAQSGLRCIAQELIPWGGDVFNDCISLFARPGAGRTFPAEPRFLENRQFWDDAWKLPRRNELFAPDESAPAAPTPVVSVPQPAHAGAL